MIKKFNIFFIIFLVLISFNAKASTLQEIIVQGNNRIPTETIKMFSNVNIGQNINEISINKILKDLYDTYYFENVSVEINDRIILINVVELPIIENINYDGVKANKILIEIKNNVSLKSRSSFNELKLKEDKTNITNVLKNLGYYYSNVDVFITKLEDNKVNINYKINLGEKSKIKKISFIGNKIYKNNKLRSLIISEEYKFWKFISGKKFLNEALIDFDKQLLKNYYLNKGYYNVVINSSFA